MKQIEAELKNSESFKLNIFLHVLDALFNDIKRC